VVFVVSIAMVAVGVADWALPSRRAGMARKAVALRPKHRILRRFMLPHLEFPICTFRVQIVRFSCPQHNEFCCQRTASGIVEFTTNPSVTPSPSSSPLYELGGSLGACHCSNTLAAPQACRVRLAETGALRVGSFVRLPGRISLVPPVVNMNRQSAAAGRRRALSHVYPYRSRAAPTWGNRRWMA
jgi:hypothetical protein